MEAPEAAVGAGSWIDQGVLGRTQGSTPLWSLRRGEETRGTASNRQGAQRARVVQREVANCALITVRRAEEASVHTGRAAHSASGSALPGLATFPRLAGCFSSPFFHL